MLPIKNIKGLMSGKITKIINIPTVLGLFIKTEYRIEVEYSFCYNGLVMLIFKKASCYQTYGTISCTKK